MKEVMEYRFYLSKRSALILLKKTDYFCAANDILNCGYTAVIPSFHDDFINDLFKINVPFRKLTLYWSGNPGVQEFGDLNGKED